MDLGFLISKLLPLFVYPLGLCLLLGSLALLLIATGWRRSAFVSLLSGLLILGVASTAPVAERLLNPLERMYAITLPEEAEVADAIVLLSGTVGIKRRPRVVPELLAGGQRLLHAARLYRASRAPLVVVAGGNAFRSGNDDQEEATAAREILMELGVPGSAIVAETQSRNTYENAIETAQILRDKGLRRILLVTSASHMPRAMAVFRSQQIDSIAQPTQIVSVETDRPSLLRWIPEAEYLHHSRIAIKEYFGFFVYRWRGWISDEYGFMPARPDAN